MIFNLFPYSPFQHYQITATKINATAPDSIVPNKFAFLRTLPSNWSSHHTTYWQHGDHLDSAAWVTDTNGLGYQHLQYMPWGEQWVDQRKTGYSYNTRYTFSGKERDEETGFSYFGARYYQPNLSIWLSVDPMSDKYPGLSPYAYCANNPVRLVDPDGEDWYENENGKVVWDDNITKQSQLKKGCTYIGATDESIAKYYKMNINGSKSTQKGGFVTICDNNQWAVVKTKTTIFTTVVTKKDDNAVTISNKSGKVFIGIKISAQANTNSTISTDGRMNFSGNLSVDYGGKTYNNNLKNDNGNIISSYAQNQNTSILIPAKDINCSKSYNNVSITGNWSIRTDCGTSMLCWPVLPYPKSLKHQYIK